MADLNYDYVIVGAGSAGTSPVNRPCFAQQRGPMSSNISEGGGFMMTRSGLDSLVAAFGQSS